MPLSRWHGRDHRSLTVCIKHDLKDILVPYDLTLDVLCRLQSYHKKIRHCYYQCIHSSWGDEFLHEKKPGHKMDYIILEMSHIDWIQLTHVQLTNWIQNAQLHGIKHMTWSGQKFIDCFFIEHQFTGIPISWNKLFFFKHNY